jgi:hypothetical protein
MQNLFEFSIVIILMFLGGFALGLAWRWHLAWLFLLCAAAGFTVFVFLRDWSDFSFSAIIQDANSIESWMIYLPIHFIPFVILVMGGGAIGLAVRRMFPNALRHR